MKLTTIHTEFYYRVRSAGTYQAGSAARRDNIAFGVAASKLISTTGKKDFSTCRRGHCTDYWSQDDFAGWVDEELPR